MANVRLGQQNAPSYKFLGDSPINKLCTSPSNRPFRVSIEGNIGAGKSTLIEYFKNMQGIETFGEPIEWWRNLNGHNLLDLMYVDSDRWLKVFQSYVQLTRLQVQTTPPKSPETTVQMFERSIQNNRYCFLEMARRNGSLSDIDFTIFDKWYHLCEKIANIDLDLIVYLRSSPDVVFQRMRARDRPEERGVPFNYIKQLHEAHENWLMTGDGYFNDVPILVLDADKALENITQQYKENEQRILGAAVDKNVDSVKKNLQADF